MAVIDFNLPDFASDRRFYRSFQKTLEDVTYTFVIQYLSRQDRFIMSIGYVTAITPFERTTR
jgi:hypothetical protein